MNQRNTWRLLRCACWAIGSAGLTGCGESAQRIAEVPLQVAGTNTAELTTDRGVPVELTRAQLAFGPLYVCPGSTAGELCETARLEWLDSAVVELLDARPRSVGTLVGVTGPVRSYMYDLGFSSVLTTDEPLVLAAARELGGASLSLEGRATVDGRSTRFEARVAIRQGAEVERGVPVVRKSASEAFEHGVRGDEGALLVRFDVRAWLERLDFASWVEEQCPDPSDPCDEPLALERGSLTERSLVLALTAGERPVFTWEDQR